MILICGLPSSGTSWVCDVLHKNGFDLGGYYDSLHPTRHYKTYEDRKLYAEVLSKYPHSLDIDRLREYIEARRGWKAAAKYPWLGVLGKDAPLVDGVRWVITKRPLEDVMDREVVRRGKGMTRLYVERVELLNRRLEEMRTALGPWGYFEVRHGELEKPSKRADLVSYCDGAYSIPKIVENKV